MTRSNVYLTFALVVGAILFALTLYTLDLSTLRLTLDKLQAAAPVILLASAGWHALRTIAWWRCFPTPARPSLLTTARVRLAAEAFSYLTISGVAGEPLKVMMLTETRATTTTAALALERVSYVVVTMVLVALSALATAVWTRLDAAWTLVFCGLAMGSAVLLVSAIAIVKGRGPYVSRLFGRQSMRKAARPGLRAMRFAIGVERQLLTLARSDRHRLIMLVLLHTACYACMVLEVYVILRAAGIATSVVEANGIETFTRVASFAAAFIPASFGALEASNVAAATALGVAAGGGALAFARRLRGLLWAALGLLIYPRRRAAQLNGQAGNATPRDPSADMASANMASANSVLAYVAEDTTGGVSPFDRIVSLTLAERVLRAAAAAGYQHVFVWTTAYAGQLRALLTRLTRVPPVTIVTDAGTWSRLLTGRGNAPLTLIGPGTIASTSLLRAAANLDDAPIEVPVASRWRVSGVFRVSASHLADIEQTRRFLSESTRGFADMPDVTAITSGRAMLALRPETPSDLRRAQTFLERATYKPTDPYLARVNRRVSIPVSRMLLRTPLSANQLSIGLVAVGFYAAWLFSRGNYASTLAGAALSLAASIADGCDGEIARLKYEESSFGCWLETFGDYAYYVAIFVGMTIGVVRSTGSPVFLQLGLAALVGMLITFALLILLRGRITGGKPERLQAATKQYFYASGSRWAWLAAKLSFCATRSSMPYGIFLFAVAGLMPAMLVLAAVAANAFWISLAIKLRGLLGAAPGDAETPFRDGAGEPGSCESTPRLQRAP